MISFKLPRLPIPGKLHKTPVPAAGVPGVHVWLKALRIKQWIKNLFVFMPFVTSDQFGINGFLAKSLEGAALFCILSSAVYLLNDIIDIESDRAHPDKRRRPVAAGQISVRAALSVAVFLAVSSIVFAARLDEKFLVILLAYAANSLLYSLYLKKKTVVDVMAISLGFVLRVYAGGFAVGIEITKWLVACVFTLALFLGFGKRRAEYEDLSGLASKIRKVHESYSARKLDLLLGISAAVTIVTYMLYALAPETRLLHGSDKLIFTTPFVVYCINRYALKVQEQRHADPTELVLHDRGFLLAGFGWLILYVYLAHFQ